MALFSHKWVYIITACALIIMIAYSVLRGKNSSQYTGSGLWVNYKIETVKIEGNTWDLVVAETPQQLSQGLMYVRKPVSEFDGMVFKFSDKKPRTFWNMNTYENLTLYWLAEGKIVGTSDLPSIELSKTIVTVESPEPVDTVIEIIK